MLNGRVLEQGQRENNEAEERPEHGVKNALEPIGTEPHHHDGEPGNEQCEYQ